MPLGRVTCASITSVTSGGDAVWDEWQRITRFLQGARLAFARENNLWTSLEISGPVKLVATQPKGRYEVDLVDHLDAVRDDETLFASVLIHSYALAESAAGDHLSVDARHFHGIEDWGYRLLDGEGKSWADLRAGRGGAVEVAVVRNAFAHGSRTIDDFAEKRLAAAGVSNLPAGTAVSLSYDSLQTYRECLRHLLNLGGIRRTTTT
jgi:hypothetical protein